MRSPKTLEHFVRGYFGTIGVQTLNGADVLTRSLASYPDAPANRPGDFWMLGRFAPEDAGKSTKYVGQFYDLHRQIQIVNNRIAILRRDGELEEAANVARENKDLLAFQPRTDAAYKSLRDIRRAQIGIHDSTLLDAGQKRAMLEELGDRRNRISRTVMAQSPTRTRPVFNPFDQ